MIKDDEWLPVAQAAQRLGLAERQARRYAARLPDTDRTFDRTPAGRERTLVRLSALSKVAQAAHGAGHRPDTSPDTDRTEDRTQEAMSVPLALAMTAQRESLERVIAEQAARIADLQASLDHERAQAQRLNEALAREQMLRALPPPAPDVIGPDTTPEPAEAATAAPPAPDPEPAAPTLWQRFGWTRRKAVQGSSEDGVK